MASQQQNDPRNSLGRLGKLYKGALAVLLAGVMAAGTISLFGSATSTPAAAEKPIW